MKFVLGPTESQAGFRGVTFDFNRGYRPIADVIAESHPVSETSTSNPLGTVTEESVVVGDYTIFGSLVYNRVGTAEQSNNGVWHAEYTETLQVAASTITKVVVNWPLGNGVSIYWDSAVAVDQVIGKSIDQFVTDGAEIWGSSASDTITTTSASEIIYTGGAGNDVAAGAGVDSIFGERNDRINAGPDDDFIFSGGFSRLTGGDGADHFAYQSIVDLGRSRFAKEVITDFEVGTDVIDLMLVDAHRNKFGNQAFKFLGEGELSDRGGEIRIVHRGRDGWAQTIIYGSNDFDERSEFAIHLKGDLAVTAADFML